MIVFVWLAFGLVLYAVLWLLWAPQARTAIAARNQKKAAQPPTGAAADSASQDLAWTALDDRQLSRLLNDPPPRNTTDEDMP